MAVHIETHEIRVFKAVYENHGFKKAADKLFVTQSAVSQTVSNLEKKLDSVLLERNPIKLTEAGIRLLNYAELVLGEEDAVLDDIKNIKQGVLSTLLLAMNGSVNQLFGSDLMAAYCEDSPLTKLKLSVMPSRQIITAVASDLWELGFGPFQQNMPDYFETMPLFTDERVLMISKYHPQLRASPEAILQQVPLIVSHLDNQDMRPALDRLRDAFGTIWEIDDTALRLSLLNRGLGMSYIDRRLLVANQYPELIPLESLTDFAAIKLQFGVYHRRGKQLSTGAQRFLNICEQFDFH